MHIGPENRLRLPQPIEIARIELPLDNREGFDAMDIWLQQQGLMPEFLLYRGCSGERLGHVELNGTDRDDGYVACMDYQTLKGYPGSAAFHPLKLARENVTPMVLMYDERLMHRELGFARSFMPGIHPTAALRQVLLINGRM